MDPAGLIDFIVAPAEAGERLDKALARRPDLSRGQARRLIAAGVVSIDGEVVRRLSRPVQTGERVRSPRALAPDSTVDLTARILHRGPDWLAVDKPSNMPTTATVHGMAGTLLAELERQLGLEATPHPVHRLDAATSGVILVALTGAAARRLAEAFVAGAIDKRYRAWVSGTLPAPEGHIDAPIGRDRRFRGRMRIDPAGKPALTVYRSLGEPTGWPGLRDVELDLRTGRTHQLRVHLAHIGCPIAGDRWYGGAPHVTAADGTVHPARRLCLHAASLTLEPGLASATAAPRHIAAPLPAFLAAGDGGDDGETA